MENRGSFASKLGVVLATAGSAVGLGNIWRFPYLTGENGGAAFILVYLVCVFILGIPGMVAEFIVGRHSASNAARAYRSLSKGEGWGAIGYVGMVTSMLILGFYAVVAGWCMQYLFASIMGELKGDAQFVANYFQEFSSDLVRPMLWGVGFVLITHFVVVKGVRNGIERFSKILMPMLFVLLLILVIASCSLPGAMAGVEFLLKPDFSKLSSDSFLDALGQAFFSLSVPILGYVIAILFYALLVLAALTSTISMHEIGTAFFTEEFHLPRKHGAWVETIVCGLLAIVCSLSCGAVPGLELFGMTVLNFCDYLTGQILLPLGALFVCLFVGWYLPRKLVKEEFTNWGTLHGGLFGIFLIMVRVVCPFCITAIFLHQLGVI